MTRNQSLPTLCLMVSALPFVFGCNKQAQPSQPVRPSTAQNAQASSAKPPVLKDTSKAQEIAAYVSYYQSRGYQITTNKQAFDAQGKVTSFQFAAARRKGTSSDTVTATVNAATHTVSTSSRSESSTSARS